MSAAVETPLLLAIETATRAGSVSLARGDQILATIAGDAHSSHSRDLLENVDAVLRTGGAKLKDLDAFVVASGPGSFTGLRIGLATTKSFAVNTGKECIGISTLAAVAYAATANGKVVSLLPAGRGELFAQMFSIDNDQIESLDSAVHLPPNEVLQRYGEVVPLTWAGEGTRGHLDMLSSWADEHRIGFVDSNAASSSTSDHLWTLAPECKLLAEPLARLGFREFRAGRAVSPQELRASYVRPSDAEIPKPWQHHA